MKRVKIENVSAIKLDFFVLQNGKDVRVALQPKESTWCDVGSSTKSMILYERKNLIKSSLEEMKDFAPPISEEDVKIMEEINKDKEGIVERAKKALEDFSKIIIKNIPPNLISHDLVSVEPISAPENSLLHFVPVTSISTEEKTETISEESTKEEKKYKGKKRGRKKKRGPKKGSKRNKGNTDSTDTDIDTDAQ